MNTVCAQLKIQRFDQQGKSFPRKKSANLNQLNYFFFTQPTPVRRHSPTPPRPRRPKPGLRPREILGSEILAPMVTENQYGGH